MYTGLANPKEYETVALMEVVLYKNIFNDDNFAVTSEQPPSLTSGRRCDLVIKYLESGSFDIKILCFAECKRADTDREFNLARLERQAKGYCKVYLDAEQDLPFVYAATMAGAHVRLWSYNRDGSWIPFWGTGYEGDWAEYKDVGDNAVGAELEHWFNQMKSYPPSAHAGQVLGNYLASNQQHTSMSSSSAIVTPGYNAPYHNPVGTSRGYAESGSADQQSKEGLCYQISESVHVTFLKFFNEHGADKVECSVDGEINHIKLPRYGWQQALMRDHEGDYTGFVYVGKSGKAYFTWTMDAEGKGKGK